MHAYGRVACLPGPAPPGRPAAPAMWAAMRRATSPGWVEIMKCAAPSIVAGGGARYRLAEQRIGALRGRMAGPAPGHQRREVDGRQRRRRQREGVGARPVEDVDGRRLLGIGAHARRPRGIGARAAVEVDHRGDRLRLPALEGREIGVVHVAEGAVVRGVLAPFPQQLHRRRLQDRETCQRHFLAQRDSHAHQSAQGMADEMHRAPPALRITASTASASCAIEGSAAVRRSAVPP